jgi:hypothetical protein
MVPFSPVVWMSNILVEPGTDRSRLLIAFTGFQGALTMPPFDFFAASGHLGSSRILLRDRTRQMYLRGCEPDAQSFGALLQRLKDEIDRLAPEKITCVGTSSGGYAAMLFGHLLEVDRVHGFAPTPYASVWLSLFKGDFEQLMNRVSPMHLLMDFVLPPSTWKYRNLPRFLRTWNGKTRYTVHVCAHHPDDMKRSELFRGVPGVEIAAHQCNTHQVARHLVREGKLLEVFRD